MTTRDWLVTKLTGYLTRAREEASTPVHVLSAEMTDDLTVEWLTREAEWWLGAAGKRGLSLSQRSMRLAVSRFYDDRAKALITATTPVTYVTPTEGETP